MAPLQFTTDTTSDGVRERDFVVDDVPGLLFSPASGAGGPLVLTGHGGGTHKRWPRVVGRAHRLVLDGGFTVAALDAPGHGDRPRTPTDEREVAALRRARGAGEPIGPVVERYTLHVARRAVPEWRAVLDALRALPEIGEGPVGWFGTNMATATGIPLVAADPRITAAVLGQFWDAPLRDAARLVTVPVEYVLQWDDEYIPRESGLALFDALGSSEKSLHANAGRHMELPRFEADSAVRFFSRHLTAPARA
ncbi:alpha/beta hydrolase [Actinomycetospora sp. TBRC 11914]|uniref:alpha/beta hydrolase n=1 Tax=Actinomycetospora sp. TBRC 11914 TaxID=2729387 RepID=UPI00145D5089|nr:alpha/beta hydrolase [Actinomycetospora sp. TBRC 11914]NMO90662.1 alpha/beta hydrolase [Actinomycetospora sp. TBRC 11914]